MCYLTLSAAFIGACVMSALDVLARYEKAIADEEAKIEACAADFKAYNCDDPAP